MGRVVVVALEQTGVVGARTEHRHPARVDREREDAFVLQEDHGGRGCPARQGSLRGCLVHGRRPGGIDVGPLEQAEAELGDEDATHRGIDRLHGDLAGLERGPERLAEAVGSRQLHVEPRVQGLHGGLVPVGCGAVMRDEEPHGEVVGHDEALEAQLLAQQARQQGATPGAGQPVHRGVGVHDRGQTGVAYRGREGLRVHLAELAGPELDGRVVHPPLRQPVAQEMLPRRHHAVPQVLSLDPADVGRPHRPGQDRVLPVGLFHPPPTRVPGHVQDGGKGMAGAHRDHLLPDHRRHLGDQSGVPGRGQSDALGEHRRVPGAQATRGLLVNDHRDPEARALNGDSLHVIDQGGDAGRAQPRPSADTCHLPDAVGDDGGGHVGVETLPGHE